jgi:hypothetical protein
MPIIKLTFVSRREKKYTAPYTEELKQMVEQFVKPQVPTGLTFHMPNPRDNMINMTVQKNIFPQLNKPLYAIVSLKMFDFDNQEGQRIIGASFHLTALMGDNYVPK